MSMIIDGISASQHLDSSGEILEVENHDISDLIEGRGVLNWEHENGSSEDIIGAIIFAKKILKKSDCDNDRQRMYWDSCGTSFVYIKVELFEDEKHPGAIAAAAMIRYYHKRKLKILAGFSIEGSTLEREDNKLTRTVGRRVALTLRPCNKSAISGVLEDSGVDSSVKKFMSFNADTKIKTVEIDSAILEDSFSKSEINPALELKMSIATLNKTLTAGQYSVAPSQLSQGSALSVEDKNMKRKGLTRAFEDKLRGAVKSWDRKRPLRETIKAALPEVSEDYVDHFTELAEEMSLKKGKSPRVRTTSANSWNKTANYAQQKITDGLYFDHRTARDPSITNIQTRNDAGTDVSVIFPTKHEEKSKNPSKTSSDYYQLASDFFDMGDHVPITNHIEHTSIYNGNHSVEVQEKKDGILPFSSAYSKSFENARNDGSAHKLAFMDMILGADNGRHIASSLSSGGRINHIDNGHAFDYDSPATNRPFYYDDLIGSDDTKRYQGIGSDISHIDASQWLQEKDPKILALKMGGMGFDRRDIKKAVQRLAILKKLSASGTSFEKMHEITHRGQK